MIDHVWSLVCSRAVVDTESNNISIQNILERITVDAEPRPDLAIPVDHEVVSSWTRHDLSAPARGQMRILWVAPSGQTVRSYTQTADLTEHANLRTRVRFPSMPYVELGRHFVCVELQDEGAGAWRRVAAIPLEMLRPSAEVGP